MNIKINNQQYKVLRKSMIGGETWRSCQNIETKEIVNLSHSIQNGFMLWIAEGTVLDPGIRCEIPKKVEITIKSEFNVYGEDGSKVPLNMTGRKFQPYRGRQFWN